MTHKSEILEASACLLETRSFRTVSIQQIARRASVHPSTVRRLFGSKEKLLRAVVREQQRQVISNPPRLDAHDSESFARAVDIYAAWGAQRFTRRFMRIYMGAEIFGPGLLTKALTPATVAMTNTVRAAQARGEVIDGDPLDLVRALRYAIVGDALLRAVDHPIAKTNLSQHETISTFARVWARGVRAL